MTLKTVETGVNRHLPKSPKSLYNIYIWLICIYMTSEESMKWHRWNIQKYFLYLANMFSVVFKNRERPPPAPPSYTLTSQKWQQVTHHFPPEFCSSILGDFISACVTICRYITKYRICQSKAFLHTPPAWIYSKITVISKFSHHSPNSSRKRKPCLQGMKSGYHQRWQ